MSDIFWLQQRQGELPEADEWLSPEELAVLSRMVVPKRKAEWRLGRWTAKCAFALLHRIPRDNNCLAEIQIRASALGSPEVLVCGQLANVTLSISHRSGAAITAVAPARTKLGCDLELIEPHSDAFVEDYFTCEERILLAQAYSHDRPLLATLLWSAKESALKAIQLGLRADTRSVNVELLGNSLAPWAALKVTCAQGDILHGWWRQQGDAVVTIVAESACHEPVQLHRSAECYSQSA